MGITLSNDVKQLVDHPNFAHLATLYVRWLAAQCARLDRPRR
jgi:hypothetical protein